MLLEFINNSLTKYLESDPEVASQLHELKGQVLLLNLTDLNEEYLITPTHSSRGSLSHIPSLSKSGQYFIREAAWQNCRGRGGSKTKSRSGEVEENPPVGCGA